MRNVNKAVLIGNLTRDPEMRTTPSGQYIATFGMATNREWMTKDGRKQQSSEFHDLVCWGRLAELANQHLKKGKLIYVEGYLKTRSWDDASGVKKFRTEIVVEDLIMLDKRQQREFSDELPEAPTRSSSDIPDDDMQPTVTMEDQTAI